MLSFPRWNKFTTQVSLILRAKSAASKKVQRKTEASPAARQMNSTNAPFLPAPGTLRPGPLAAQHLHSGNESETHGCGAEQEA